MADEISQGDDGQRKMPPTTGDSAPQGQSGQEAPPPRAYALARRRQLWQRPVAPRPTLLHSGGPRRQLPGTTRRTGPISWAVGKLRGWVVLVAAALLASATYQAGLHPPGGTWQDDAEPKDGTPGHTAGNPIMRDKNGTLYGAFWACNSAAFAACLAAVVVLLDEFAFGRHRMSAARSLVRANVVVMGIAYAFALPAAGDMLSRMFAASIVLIPLVWSFLWRWLRVSGR